MNGSEKSEANILQQRLIRSLISLSSIIEELSSPLISYLRLLVFFCQALRIAEGQAGGDIPVFCDHDHRT